MRRAWVFSGALLASSAALMTVFSHGGRAFFPAYRNLSKTVMGVLADVFSVVPIACWDVLGVAAAFVALLTLVRCLAKRRSVVAWLARVVLLGSVTVFVFVGGWALNHFAPPLSEELDLDVKRYSVEELATTTQACLSDAALLAPKVPRDDDGSLAEQDFFELAKIAGSAYAGLSEEYEVFVGSTRPVKALTLVGEPLLYSGHVGVFFAPTGESSVPLNCARADLPFTMCHEAAHRLGIAREQEANFAAYLACATSDDVRLQYSGSLNAFAYCMNALYAQDPELLGEVVDRVREQGVQDGVRLVFADLSATSTHYDAYKGTFEEFGTKVNDQYLRSFGEDQGVKSYGLVVDYLIAWRSRV